MATRRQAVFPAVVGMGSCHALQAYAVPAWGPGPASAGGSSGSSCRSLYGAHSWEDA